MHPQSIVHGMVEFRDGSVVAQLGAPDMRIPIAHCLAWPDAHRRAGAKRLDLAEIGSLTFEEPDLDRFPGAGAWPGRRCEAGAARRHRPQCRQRDRGRGIPRPAGSASAAFAALVEATLDAAARRGMMREPRDIDERSPLTIFTIVGARPLARNRRKGILGNLSRRLCGASRWRLRP